MLNRRALFALALASIFLPSSVAADRTAATAAKYFSNPAKVGWLIVPSLGCLHRDTDRAQRQMAPGYAFCTVSKIPS